MKFERGKKSKFVSNIERWKLWAFIRDPKRKLESRQFSNICEKFPVFLKSPPERYKQPPRRVSEPTLTWPLISSPVESSAIKEKYNIVSKEILLSAQFPTLACSYITRCLTHFDKVDRRRICLQSERRRTRKEEKKREGAEKRVKRRRYLVKREAIYRSFKDVLITGFQVAIVGSTTGSIVVTLTSCVSRTSKILCPKLQHFLSFKYI